MNTKLIALITLILIGAILSGCAVRKEPSFNKPPEIPSLSSIDETISTAMNKHKVPGLAVAIIDSGKLVRVKGYGFRSLEKNLPLNEDTVMYAASLTKFVFSSYVQSLSDDGRIDLDQSIADLLPKPLPDYEDYSDLQGDERWKKLTLRALLSHTTGFPNYRFFPPEGGFNPKRKLEFYFEPGQRYGYSGEGYYIAQLVVEEYLNLKVGKEMESAIFKPLSMHRSSMTWSDSFLPNISHGYTAEGELKGHSMRSNARAAGSLDSSINDLSKWLIHFINKKNNHSSHYQSVLFSNIEIKSPYQFPTLEVKEEPKNQNIDLSAGLGVVTWKSPYGLGFFKGGHNDITDNLLICLDEQQRCVLLMSNTAKGHLIFPEIADFILGETNFPWHWEYNL